MSVTYISTAHADEAKRQIALGKPKRQIEIQLGLSYGLLDRKWAGRDETPEAKAEREKLDADWSRRFSAYERHRDAEIRDHLSGRFREPEGDS